MVYAGYDVCTTIGLVSRTSIEVMGKVYLTLSIF